MVKHHAHQNTNADVLAMSNINVFCLRQTKWVKTSISAASKLSVSPYSTLVNNTGTK